MKKKYREWFVAFLFILPSFLGIAFFYVVPYIICFVKSMYIGERFVGMSNYIELFTNKTFLLALKNTLIFMVVAISVLLLLSLAIAVFLNSFQKISCFLKSSLLIPVVLPVASLTCVWQLLFDDYGVINHWLNKCGISSVAFFNSKYSMIMIVAIFVWKYLGFCVVLLTAGMARVPLQIYESARLDGAGPFRIFTRMTLPMITPTIFFVFLMETIYSFKIFREVFALFGNYPNENVYFLQNFINNNYYNLNYPRLSASSIILSIFIIAFLFVFFLIEKKRGFME